MRILFLGTALILAGCTTAQETTACHIATAIEAADPALQAKYPGITAGVTIICDEITSGTSASTTTTTTTTATAPITTTVAPAAPKPGPVITVVPAKTSP